jgi:Family of unknown function (DUF5681)
MKVGDSETGQGLSVTNSPDNTGQKQDTRFQPGQSGNPAGRPKGARNKLSENLLKVLADDFDSHGRDAIEKLRESDAGQYVRMIVSILPKRVENRRAELLVERLPDEELARIIRETRQVLASVEIDIDEDKQTE